MNRLVDPELCPLELPWGHCGGVEWDAVPFGERQVSRVLGPVHSFYSEHQPFNISLLWLLIFIETHLTKLNAGVFILTLNISSQMEFEFCVDCLACLWPLYSIKTLELLFSSTCKSRRQWPEKSDSCILMSPQEACSCVSSPLPSTWWDRGMT